MRIVKRTFNTTIAQALTQLAWKGPGTGISASLQLNELSTADSELLTAGAQGSPLCRFSKPDAYRETLCVWILDVGGFCQR